ncbi:MAG: hypothetical protein K2K27_02550 [Muribaculaceae bacterium]|nr:hypothetical protein [Muribaculaceae bacterium]
MSLKIFHNALFATAILLLAGCSEQMIPNNEELSPAEDRVELSIATEVPFETEVQARSAFSDVAISNCDAIVFDENGKLIEVVRCGAATDEIGNDGEPTGRKRINILLPKNLTPAKRTIHLVANARYPGTSNYRVDMTHLVEKVTTEAQAMQNMETFDINGNRSYDSQTAPCIMWTRIVLPVGIQDNCFYNTDERLQIPVAERSPKFLRAEAMINVELADATDENNLDDLEIISMCPLHFQEQGYVCPTTYNQPPTTTPTVARPAGRYSTVFPLINNDNWWMPFSPRSFFFAYERNCTSGNNTGDYMTIILKARFRGVLGYYKIVLMQNASTPFNIIRNHRYNIRIVSVGGEGYADLQTCIASKPGNALNVSILDADATYNNTASDSNYRLSLDCHRFELYRNATTDNQHSLQSLVLAKVYTNRTLGTPRVIQDEASTSWLRSPVLNQVAGGTYELMAEFASADNTSYETTLTIKFDNLETYLDVVWHPSGTATSDINSYVITFPRQGETNWAIQMVSPKPFNLAHQFLSPTVSDPGAFDGVNANSAAAPTAQRYTSINSRFQAHAYYHLKRESRYVSQLKYNYTKDGKPVNATLVFYQE